MAWVGQRRRTLSDAGPRPARIPLDGAATRPFSAEAAIRRGALPELVARGLYFFADGTSISRSSPLSV
jgi:hypothetical protein